MAIASKNRACEYWVSFRIESIGNSKEIGMLLKRTSPNLTFSSGRRELGIGDRMLAQAIIADRLNQIQAVVTGNRCGHVPSVPRFFVRPVQHKPRPSILASAIDKLKDVYCRPKKFFGTLATFHPDDRQKRSERREAVASVSQVLLHYLELSTLKVGFYVDPNKFIPLDLKYIAKKAGISLSRAKRAIRDLAKAGYIKLTRQFNKKDDGTFKGLPSIREIAVQFFIDLGVDMQKLFHSREWKRKKEEKASAKVTQKVLGGLMRSVGAFAKRVTSSSVKRQNKPSIGQDLISQALALHKANPERSCGDYLKELQQLKE